MKPGLLIAAATAILSVVVIAVGIQVTHDRNIQSIRANQLDGCHLVNIHRTVISTNEQVLAAFLLDAATTRHRQAVAYLAAGNKVQAALNEGASRRYAIQLARLRAIGPINCDAILK